MKFVHRFHFSGTTHEVIDHVRWCRQNLGTLGETWDFASSGLGKKVDVWIASDKAAVWYKLKFLNVEKYQ